MLDTIKFTSKIDYNYIIIGYNAFKSANKAPLWRRFIINCLLLFILLLSFFLAYINIKGVAFPIFTIAVILFVNYFPRHVKLKNIKERYADEIILSFEIDESAIFVLADENNYHKSDWGKVKSAIFANLGILLIYNDDYIDLLRFSDMDSDMKSRLNELVRRKVPPIKDCI